MSYDVSIELKDNSCTGHESLHVITILTRCQKVDKFLEMMGYHVYYEQPEELQPTLNLYVELEADISKLENIIETIKMLGVSMEVKYHYGTESRKEVYGAAEQAVHTQGQE